MRRGRSTRTGAASWPAKRWCAPMPRTPWTILRPSAVYGPRDRQFLPLVPSGRARPLPRRSFPPATWRSPFIYVDDLARGVVLASEGEARVGRRPCSSAIPSRAMPTICCAPSPTPFGVDTARGTCLRRAARPSRGLASWRGHSGSSRCSIALGLAELRAEGFVCSVDRAREVLGFTAAVAAAGWSCTDRAWYRNQGWV